MQPFACGQCGNTVFFDNVQCVRCNAALGFVPGLRRMLAFAVAEPGAAPWPALGGDTGLALQPCANRQPLAVYNWMIDAGDTHAQCLSCRLTQAIPSLQDPANLQRWRRFEQAKRRLVFTLMLLGLPPVPKQGPDDASGLEIQLLATLPGQPPVMTGHDDGKVTVNLAEADDLQRETARLALGEPQRSLLGHLRHETAHYLQQRYIDGTPAQARCREVFGDERSDYPAALAKYYAQGAPADWQQHFVSAYASAHPWEDWAETCAHYLLVVDAVQTAAAWGLTLNGPAVARPSSLNGSAQPPIGDLVLQQWLPVAQFLNAMNRSLGQPDSYPYQMPDAVLAKLATVQTLLQAAAGPQAGPVRASNP